MDLSTFKSWLREADPFPGVQMSFPLLNRLRNSIRRGKTNNFLRIIGSTKMTDEQLVGVMQRIIQGCRKPVDCQRKTMLSEVLLQSAGCRRVFKQNLAQLFASYSQLWRVVCALRRHDGKLAAVTFVTGLYCLSGGAFEDTKILTKLCNRAFARNCRISRKKFKLMHCLLHHLAQLRRRFCDSDRDDDEVYHMLSLTEVAAYNAPKTWIWIRLARMLCSPKLFKKAWKKNERLLFYYAVRKWDFKLAADFAGKSIGYEDLEYVVDFVIAHAPDLHLFTLLDLPRMVRNVPSSTAAAVENRALLAVWSDFYRNTASEKPDTFLKIYSKFIRNGHDTFQQLFFAIVDAALERGDVKLFVDICDAQYPGDRLTIYLTRQGLTEQCSKRGCQARVSDFKAAHAMALQKGKEEFVLASLQHDSLKGKLPVLTELILEQKAWATLKSFVLKSFVEDLSETTRKPLLSFERSGVQAIFLEALEMCLRNMFRCPDSWPECSAALDLWLQAAEFGHLAKIVHRLQKSLLSPTPSNPVENERSVSCTSKEKATEQIKAVMQRCMDLPLPHLALLLGLILGDHDAVCRVLSKHDLNFPSDFLMEGVFMMLSKGDNNSAAAFLRRVPFTEQTILDAKQVDRKNQLVGISEAYGLHDWLLVLLVPWFSTRMFQSTSHKEDWDRVHIQLQKPFAYKQAALEFVLRITLSDSPDISKDMLLKFWFGQDTLQHVMKAAFQRKLSPLAETAIKLVDPTTVFVSNSGLWENKYGYVGFVEAVERLKLCIRTGVSAAHRKKTVPSVGILGQNLALHCPIAVSYLRCGYTAAQVLIIARLLLASGAYSQSLLYRIASTREFDRNFRRKPEMQEVTAVVEEAATNPCRLEHLARVTVSNLIGTRPGRAERIDALEMAEPVNNLLNFKDDEFSVILSSVRG